MQRNSIRPSPLNCDEVDKIWLHVAGQLGFTVSRSDEAYASSDGHGTILIGTAETLDADDCVAQLVFHELCHALVEGEQNLMQVDWGLANTDDRDISREYATLRLQAHFADKFGMRVLFAPTTQWRPYYAELAEDPLQGTDLAAGIVEETLQTALTRRWQPVLESALARTQVALQTKINTPL